MRTDRDGQSAVDVLGAETNSLFFRVRNPVGLNLRAPVTRNGVSLRTWARSLSGMQKEAIVVNGASGVAWRLASDEGPYLAGHDSAPCPLSFMTTGMVASYANQILMAATEEGIDASGLRLTLDNYYTMEGSALRGTMSGGARSPQLSVELPAAPDRVQDLAGAATAKAPITALMRGVNESLFSLTVNGVPEDVGRVAPLDGPRESDPGDGIANAEPDPDWDTSDVIERLTPAAEVVGVPGGKGSSLQENQSRTLHVRGVCTVRGDGVKEIVQNLYSPIGSEFRFLSDEAPGFGGEGRAPDAATYMSAGIAFCFMTQFGRYATIVRKHLADYRIVQDTHFTGRGDPVESHVFLETAEGPDFGRTVLDMSEQTCFLHALCRTDLDLTVARL